MRMLGAGMGIGLSSENIGKSPKGRREDELHCAGLGGKAENRG